MHMHGKKYEDERKIYMEGVACSFCRGRKNQKMHMATRFAHGNDHPTFNEHDDCLVKV